MCGIAALQLKNSSLQPQLGALMGTMLCEIVDRGTDSAGMAIYGDPDLSSPGGSTVTVLDATITGEKLVHALGEHLPARSRPVAETLGETTVIRAGIDTATLEAAIALVMPGATIAGRGEHVAVLKGTGHPLALAEQYGLNGRSGTQGVSHTRMATESAVTATGSHPFTVSDDLCLVHNGSFSNHASIRRRLRRLGVEFDSENDSEVAARYISWRMRQGDDLTEALHALAEVFDGFYTLVVTTADSMAVVRDPISCKPAIIAETDDWVAMASEYRALAGLPGVENARIFEPEPGRVYIWTTPARELVSA